ncbi:MAG: hypothetical protein ACI4GE_07785, partial [Lachnospiraceae bacterium]
IIRLCGTFLMIDVSNTRDAAESRYLQHRFVRGLAPHSLFSFSTVLRIGKTQGFCVLLILSIA